LSIDRELTFSDGDKIYAGMLFFRKKDAKKYLDTFEYKQYFEIIGMNIDEYKTDNGKKINNNGKNSI